MRFALLITMILNAVVAGTYNLFCGISVGVGSILLFLCSEDVK